VVVGGGGVFNHAVRPGQNHSPRAPKASKIEKKRKRNKNSELRLVVRTKLSVVGGGGDSVVLSSDIAFLLPTCATQHGLGLGWVVVVVGLYMSHEHVQ
jgi:hypothetical protein